jgi:hypothetical protein
MITLSRRKIMNEQNSQPTNLSPSKKMMQLIWPGALSAQAIYAAAKLRIADLVTDGPKTSEDLALATKSDAPSLRRLIRALTGLGIFKEDEAGKFHHTDLSKTLCSNHPESVRNWVIMLGAPFFWRPCGQLYESIMTGKQSFDQIFGKPFFQYLAENPEDAAIFNSAMTAGSSINLSLILKTYDFLQFKRVVDVGGGHGSLLHGILSNNPEVHGVLYDLPEVVAGAADLQTETMAGRCELRGGDFFKEIPGDADGYILKSIIHDWNDENALTILRNCRSAINRDGKLLLIELIKKPSTEPQEIFTDLMMLVLLGGQERTESDFRVLLQEAGFSLERIIPIVGSESIIECHPQ